MNRMRNIGNTHCNVLLRTLKNLIRDSIFVALFIQFPIYMNTKRKCEQRKAMTQKEH